MASLMVPVRDGDADGRPAHVHVPTSPGLWSRRAAKREPGLVLDLEHQVFQAKFDMNEV